MKKGKGLPYHHHWIDRHGKPRNTYRPPRGGKQIPLPGAPYSPGFMEAYWAARAGDVHSRSVTGAGRIVPGTVNAAVINYLNSAAFQSLAPETRRARGNILERFRVEHGDKRVALLQRVHIDRMVAAKAATPSAAQNFLSALRIFMGHCILEGWRTDDPTRGIRLARVKSAGYPTWGEDHIAIYRAAYPLGMRERLALEVPLGTAQRLRDFVRLGRQHVRDGLIHVRQQKTGAMLAIPLHPDLARAIEAMPGPSSQLTFLTTAGGKPFSPGGFANWFRTLCESVGLRGLSAHGLRKAACRRLAEAGCSANVIQAISGHASLREVQRYVEAADQARLARSGIDTVATAFPSTRTSSGKPE
jgi:integrase